MAQAEPLRITARNMRGICAIAPSDPAAHARDQPCEIPNGTPRIVLPSHGNILLDESTKKERKQRVEDFKEGKIDILFVYNMLLTAEGCRFINNLIINEYLAESQGQQTRLRIHILSFSKG